MTDLQMKLMLKAVGIRLSRQENINIILDSYTKLTPDERQDILQYFSNKGAF